MIKVSKQSAILVAIFFLISCGQNSSAITTESLPVSLTPLTATSISIDAVSTAVVQYIVTNNSSGSISLDLTSFTGITQNNGVGLCPDPIVLAQSQSCTLSLTIDGSTLPDSIAGGPYLCLSGGSTCTQPDGADILDVTLL